MVFYLHRSGSYHRAFDVPSELDHTSVSTVVILTVPSLMTDLFKRLHSLWSLISSNHWFCKAKTFFLVDSLNL